MANLLNDCGLCCKLFYINLSKAEYESGKFRTIYANLDSIDDFDAAEDCGATLLEKKDDNSCIYLKENLCSIHDTRPAVCREFFCTTKEDKFQNMVDIIKDADKDKVSSIYEQEFTFL